jgi:nitroreductase
MEDNGRNFLAKIIRKRRTQKPSHFKATPPGSSLISDLIDIARHAPNHHRTQPARFYLLNKERITKVGKLFGEIVAGDGSNSILQDKGKRKAKEWGNAPGLLIVSCLTDLSSELLQKKPEVKEEDYATCACICQNLLLLMEAEGISTKWSTGPVWKHPQFASTVGLHDPENERIVALLFYGFSDMVLPDRDLASLPEHLTTYL